MFLRHKVYILFATFFSHLLFLRPIYDRPSSFFFFKTVVQKWESYLTTCFNFPPVFCKDSQKYNSKYNLHSLVLDFFLCFIFFSAYFLRSLSGFSMFYYSLYLKTPKSSPSRPTLTKLSQLTQNTCLRLLQYQLKYMMAKLLHYLKFNYSKIRIYGEWF